MPQWIFLLDSATCHTTYVAHGSNVYYVGIIYIVLIVAIVAVEVGNAAIVFEDVVVKHGFHFVYTHRHTYGVVSVGATHHDITFAVHHGHTVYLKRYAFHRNGTALIGYRAMYGERRLVGEVHRMGLRLQAY